MKFTKYHKYGAYHWEQYDGGGKYTRHVDRIVQWVKEKDILDVGAGDGLITNKIGAVGVDNEPEAIRLAREKGATVLSGDAYHIPFEDESFDAVTMFDVLEHLERPKEALADIHHVTRFYLYITTPPKRDDGKLTDKFHYFELSPQGLQELVESCGFELEGAIRVYPKEKVMYAKFRKR